MYSCFLDVFIVTLQQETGIGLLTGLQPDPPCCSQRVDGHAANGRHPNQIASHHRAPGFRDVPSASAKEPYADSNLILMSVDMTESQQPYLSQTYPKVVTVPRCATGYVLIEGCWRRSIVYFWSPSTHPFCPFRSGKKQSLLFAHSFYSSLSRFLAYRSFSSAGIFHPVSPPTPSNSSHLMICALPMMRSHTLTVTLATALLAVPGVAASKKDSSSSSLSSSEASTNGYDAIICGENGYADGSGLSCECLPPLFPISLPLCGPFSLGTAYLPARPSAYPVRDIR